MLSDSPRAKGKNPRAKGTNPRAKGTNPKARKARARQDEASAERTFKTTLGEIGEALANGRASATLASHVKSNSHRTKDRIQVCISLPPKVRALLTELTAGHAFREQSRVVAALIVEESARRGTLNGQALLDAMATSFEASLAAMNAQLRQYGLPERFANGWRS